MITNNLEVSVLSDKDVKSLERLDHQLIRRVLQINSKQSPVLMMLELGLKSVKYCLVKKRLMFLHHLLTSPDKSLSKINFYRAIKVTTTI